MGEQRLLVDIYIIEWELHVKIIEACRDSTIMHVFVNRCGMKMSPFILINLTIHVCNCYCWISLLNQNSYRGMHLVRTPNECHTCL